MAQTQTSRVSRSTLKRPNSTQINCRCDKKHINGTVGKNAMAAAFAGIRQNVNEGQMHIVTGWLSGLNAQCCPADPGRH